MKIRLITFGGNGINYYSAVNRLIEQANRLNFFDEIIGYTDIDLQQFSNFWDSHKNFIINNKKGYGYWLWKPFLILESLKNLNYGDIIFYLDCGCELDNDNINSLNCLIQNVIKHEILYTSTHRMESYWTKKDLIHKLNINADDSFFLHNAQIQAGALIIMKTANTVKLYEDIYNICCSDNYHYIDDTPSILPNNNPFYNHRHDQSILSLMIKLYKKKLGDYFGNFFECNTNAVPIYYVRNISENSIINMLTRH